MSGGLSAGLYAGDWRWQAGSEKASPLHDVGVDERVTKVDEMRCLVEVGRAFKGQGAACAQECGTYMCVGDGVVITHVAVIAK